MPRNYFGKKVKRLKKNHNIFAAKGCLDLEKKGFLETFKLGQKTDKIFCFSKNREHLWLQLGFPPTLVAKGQDYAQIL